ETERCRRYGRRLAFMYVDLDNLKAINDTHGHIVGDAVLKGIARILNQSVRAGDTAARYGGDEFAIILPEASLQDAAAAAERIRKTVAETTFRAPGVESAARATLSIGVAAWRPEMQDAAGLVHAADLAQYQAKARGGNTVGVLEPPQGPAEAQQAEQDANDGR
ncbi:MAG: GGDEF domain-containing protein, partial [Armatimonadota bacterium]